MNYPQFFDDIQKITLKDELSNFLGTFEDGIVEFSYLDVVKSAGHSCPTVAGAYIMTVVALKELYKDELPKRGEIAISFKENSLEGVAGVVANVITQITGATETSGFKGIGGKFSRVGLMKFDENITSSVKFERVDTKKSVEIIYNPNLIEANLNMQILMKKILNNVADDKEKKEFGKLWQQRVENIFKNIDKVVKVI